MKQKEIKYQVLGEVRALQDSRRIEGKAISFETESNDLGFVEILHRGCITDDTISRSDIVFNYNHDRNQILARCKQGNGTLSIEVREDGVYFGFDVPETRFGDEVLEQVRRGDLCSCSFAFTMPKDNTDCEKWSKRDGKLVREIFLIERLYDLAVVVDPAYNDTYISARNAEIAEIESTLKDDELDTSNNDSSQFDSDEEVEEVTEETKDESLEEDETKETDNRNLNTNNNKNTIMEKQFSLIKAIRSVANNKALDELSQAVVEAGAAEMRKSGINYVGQIQLPSAEVRGVTVTTEGEDVVATDVLDVVRPLTAKNVMVQAGAKFVGGLVGDLQYPVMSAVNTTWEGETASASDGSPTFTSVKLTPHRLTTVVPISKQFILQDSAGAEAAIREEIINAINTKLEATILGSAAGTATQPAGLFADSSQVEDVASYADVCELEAEVETNNVYGNMKYILSPKAKSALRSMIKGTNGTGMVFEAGEVDGTDALVTSNVPTGKFVYGDFSNYIIASWGNIDLTVDNITLAADGQIRLVVNAYFDAKPLRQNAFALGSLS